jgi:hypothetical protein
MRAVPRPVPFLLPLSLLGDATTQVSEPGLEIGKPVTPDLSGVTLGGRWHRTKVLRCGSQVLGASACFPELLGELFGLNGEHHEDRSLCGMVTLYAWSVKEREATACGLQGVTQAVSCILLLCGPGDGANLLSNRLCLAWSYRETAPVHPTGASNHQRRDTHTP